MAEPFLAEIRLMSFVFAPRGWAQCNGQLLSINQNQALFSLLGTTFGGNGQTTFALPDLRGRLPMHVGAGHTLGEAGGEQSHTVSIGELPVHTHMANATPSATEADPTGASWASPGKQAFGLPANAAMAQQSISNTGGSQAHENLSPFLTLNFCIALQGIFPSQN
jgi:microcystin-dependent protein